MKIITAANNAKNGAKITVENTSPYETHLSHFILWISNPLKEEIFVELGIIVSLLRVATLACIWTEKEKNAVALKDDSLDVQVGDSASLSLKITKIDHIKLEPFSKLSICPLLGCKWTELRKTYEGNLLLQIIHGAKSYKEIEELFYKKLQAFSNSDNVTLEYLVEAILNLKETELKEIPKLKKKFYFLNWNTREDLKELIQKLCEWLQFFDEKELQLQDTGLTK